MQTPRSSAWAWAWPMAIVLVYLLIVVNFQILDRRRSSSSPPCRAALAGIAWMLFITGTHAERARRSTGAHHDHGRGHGQQYSAGVASRASSGGKKACRPLSAALEAGATRMRPVLMTALAMIIGMIPMALGLGEGARTEPPPLRAAP